MNQLANTAYDLILFDKVSKPPCISTLRSRLYIPFRGHESFRFCNILSAKPIDLGSMIPADLLAGNHDCACATRTVSSGSSLGLRGASRTTFPKGIWAMRRYPSGIPKVSLTLSSINGL